MQLKNKSASNDWLRVDEVDLSLWVFWLVIIPTGLFVWAGLIGFVFWLLTEPLASLAEKVGSAFQQGKDNKTGNL